jgi:hypothetical protein
MTGIEVADGGLAMVAAGELIILCLVFLFTWWFCLFPDRDHASQSAAGCPRGSLHPAGTAKRRT